MKKINGIKKLLRLHKKKRLKMVIYKRQPVKRHLSKSKSHSLMEAHDQNTSRSEKISSQGNITLSLLGQNAVRTNSISDF